MEYSVIDIETTGLSKYYHKITEIAAVKIRDGKEFNKFQTLINPQTRIPSFITKLTGIDNELVKDAPKIHEVLPKFVDFLGGDLFVAHNATFDYGFLEHNLKFHHNYDLTNNRICTRKLANRLLPILQRKRLQDLCEHFEIENQDAHRAMGDVNATLKVFTHMLEMLKEKEISDIDNIIKFEKSVIRRYG